MSTSWHGPVVLGVGWWSGMRDPDRSGWIRVRGQEMGGHCICAVGVNVEQKYVILVNSWGKDWGRNGRCRISFADVTKLLRTGGEACVPVRRA